MAPFIAGYAILTTRSNLFCEGMDRIYLVYIPLDWKIGYFGQKKAKFKQ
jgi:hypothetical protein